jgi:hypothetical protein
MSVLVDVSALGVAQVQHIRTMNAQLTAMRLTHHKYAVDATAFYSSYGLLKEHGIRYEPRDVLSCAHPQSLAISYGTTTFCALP